MRTYLRIPALATLLAAAVVGACGGGSSDTTAPTSGISTAALNYLNQALDWEQNVSYYSPKINWTTMRADVIKYAGNAQKPADTYAAIQYSIDHYLKPFGDEHSGFWPPSSAPGRSDSPSNDVHYQIVQTVIAPKIAYLQMPSYSGTNDQGHLDSTITALAALDAQNPCGWILDLRTNLGGTWAVMMSALNTFVGNGDFLGAVYNDNSKITLFARNGVTGVFDLQANKSYTYLTPARTFTLSHARQPVALLQGINTASAGEMILLAFRGSGTPYRTFGAPSRGVTSTPAGTYLTPDSAFLNITAGIMYDRSGQLWGVAVPPDQAVSGPSWPTAAQASDPVVQAAVAWLNSRVECGGTVSERAPSFVRFPSTSAGAPEAGPNDPRPRVSRYFGGPSQVQQQP